jgi:hypothetical protein
MERWISHSIAPLGVLLLLINIIIFFSADYISRIILKLANYLLIFTLILYFLLGIFSIVLAITQNADNSYIESHWNLLSSYSKIYYYNNDIKNLFDKFVFNMVLTGGFYLFTFIFGFFEVVFIYIYNDKISTHWRPPLRSKLRDERSERYIRHFNFYEKEYNITKKNDVENNLALASASNNNDNNMIKSDENNINNNENANLISKSSKDEKNKENIKENSKDFPYNYNKESNELASLKNNNYNSNDNFNNFDNNNNENYNDRKELGNYQDDLKEVDNENYNRNANENFNDDNINNENNNDDRKSVIGLNAKNLQKRSLKRRKINSANE